MKEKLDALVNQMVEDDIDYEDAVGEFEKRFIRRVMDRANGNQSKAAKTLDIHRNTLSRKLEQLGLANKPRRRQRASR